MNDFIFQWIIGSLPEYDDQHIILENQNGPIPDDEFITFALINVQSSDYPFINQEVIEPFETAKETKYKNCKLTFSINVYSNMGFQDLDQLDLAREDVEISKLFYDNKVSYHGKSITRSIPKFGDVKHLPRYQADYYFNIYISREQMIQLIRLYRFGFSVEGKDDSFEVDLTEG